MTLAQVGYTNESAEHIINALKSSPFYATWEFWISLIIGLAGLTLSLLSFFEAREAKRAAKRAEKAAQAAGKTVKLQTVVIELSEISQRLETIDPSLDFSYARELLNEASRRLRRQLAPFQADEDISEVVLELYSMVDTAKLALGGVRPTGAIQPLAADQAASEVFLAVESHFSAIATKLAELTGLLEKRTINPESL